MNCQVFEAMLSSYMDGQLPSADAAALEEHLSMCESCRRTLLELKMVKSALETIPCEEPPPELHGMIVASLGQARTVSGGRLPRGLRDKLSRWTLRQWVPAIAAAMVFVIFVSVGSGVWYANRKQGLGLAGNRLSMGKPKSEGNEAAGLDVRMMAPAKIAAQPGAGADLGAGGVQSVSGETTRDSSGEPAAYGTLSDVDRKIIRRAQMSLEVARGNVRRVSEEAVNLVKANYGYVESSSMTESGETLPKKEIASFYMVARVPSENLDNTMAGITLLGKSTRQDTSAQDITDQYVDLDARLRNKENQEARLLQIMGEAKTVGELLQVEGELTRVRGDIESMKAQKMRYDKSIAMSTLSLTVTEEGAFTPPSPWPWQDVWQAFLNAWRTLLLLAAKVVPTLIVVGLVSLVVALVLRKRRPRPT